MRTQIASRKLSISDAEILISKGKTGVLAGFVSKSKRKFSAMLKLDEASTGNVTFEFRRPEELTEAAMTEGIEIRRFLKKIRTTQVMPNKHNIVDKHRFGDARISAVYAQAKRYIIDRKVLRLYQKIDLRLGFLSIVICNTWRIDKALDSSTVEIF